MVDNRYPVRPPSALPVPHFEDQPLTRSERWLDPARKIGRVMPLFRIWAVLNAFVAIMMTVYPYNFPYTFELWDLTFVSMALFTIFVVLAHRLPLKYNHGVGMALLLTCWGIIVTLHASATLGRLAEIKYYHLWPLFGIVCFYSTSIAVYVEPRIRRPILNIYLSLISVSGIFGILQFLGVGFARRVAFAEIQYYDTTTVVRAVGLTGFPSFLAFQGMIGCAVLASRIRTRRLMPYELALFGLFSLTTLVAQYRTLIAGIVVVWFVALLLSLRREGIGALRYPALAGALFVILAFGFSDRFSYVLGTKFGQDKAVKFREDYSWSQLDYIWHNRPWTGIGPDNALMLTNPDPTIGADQWSRYVMDSSYRLLLACYGVPGLIIGILGMFAILTGCIRVLLDRALSDDTRNMALAAAIVCFAFIIAGYFTNFFIYLQTLMPFALIMGLAGKGWREANRPPMSAFEGILRRGPRLYSHDKPPTSEA